MQLKVNRCLKDKAMNHIDHALGRPVNPLGETYREHFAVCASEAGRFRDSGHWREGRTDTDLVWFYVTRAGREALADHLKAIDNKSRHFVVSWGGYDMDVVAETHSKARYKKWVEVSDAIDISFGEFTKTARVRLPR